MSLLSGVVLVAAPPQVPTIVAPPPEPSGAIVIPAIGPAGDPLDPEQRADLIDEIENDLEPPVTLVLLFNNALV